MTEEFYYNISSMYNCDIIIVPKRNAMPQKMYVNSNYDNVARYVNIY